MGMRFKSGSKGWGGMGMKGSDQGMGPRCQSLENELFWHSPLYLGQRICGYIVVDLRKDVTSKQ